jgi:hypothetical protein
MESNNEKGQGTLQTVSTRRRKRRETEVCDDWYINTVIDLLDVIRRPAFYLKQRF